MKKRILDRSRIRTIQGGFAFFPHRFMNDGFIKRLGPDELLLYFFLVTVSDANGLSYYGDPAVCGLLGTSLRKLARCRQILIDEDLVAFEPPLYQVLELPAKPVEESRTTDSIPPSSPSSFSQLIDSMRD
ncbi:MAG: hypothetical protein GY866_14745 [Proteobacteria bacterium]|nr:hypothetical protein [Pseudomonadota bacterium]